MTFTKMNLLPVKTVKADNRVFRLQWYQNHLNFHCYQQIFDHGVPIQGVSA
jgi:hypothetical protein